MVKSRRVKKIRRVGGVSRKKLNSKRRGRGKVHELPFLVKTMLNNVNVKANNAEFYEKGIVEKIMTMVPKRDVVKALATKALADRVLADKAKADKVNADKSEYERRILAALPLNEKILKTQEAEIKRLEMSGLDGPAQRTRSKAKHATNPVLEELRLEAYHSRMVIMQLQYLAREIREGKTTVPNYCKDYAEFLKGMPGWDMERMAYVKRQRPPGYENYDKLKAKEKAEAEEKAKAEAKAEAKAKAEAEEKAKAEAKAEEKAEAEAKVETTEDPVKLKKLALELYKKSSAMKAQAKEDIIQMGRDVDKERIDIMLENNFYGLTDKQLEVWIAKAKTKAK
jgi:predicted  nucleic acid-binding Zn-ribbon protein